MSRNCDYELESELLHVHCITAHASVLPMLIQRVNTNLDTMTTNAIRLWSADTA